MSSINVQKVLKRIEVAMPYEQESTYLPDWGNTPEKNASHLDYLLELNPRVVAIFKKGGREWEVYHTVDDDLDIYFVHDLGAIQYCVEVETFNLTGDLTLKTVAQTSVWRNKDYMKLNRIAGWIFNNLLFPKYGSIMSDEVQSKDGKRFWAYQVSDAIDAGLFVYGFGLTRDKISNPIQIFTEDDTVDFYSKGTNYTGRDKRLLISQRKLDLV